MYGIICFMSVTYWCISYTDVIYTHVFVGMNMVTQNAEYVHIKEKESEAVVSHNYKK